jgi:hypothetical protein
MSGVRAMRVRGSFFIACHLHSLIANSLVFVPQHAPPIPFRREIKDILIKHVPTRQSSRVQKLKHFSHGQKVFEV